MAKAVSKSSKMSQKLDARPDRVDFRDRPYLPPLRSLPPQWPPKNIVAQFIKLYEPLILDQGEDGFCTGFGLAALINYINWYAEVTQKLQANHGSPGKIKLRKTERISEHMLYQNARLYDEWDGEDYEGSSCRGAMKGWHKHGACLQKFWNKSEALQGEEWRSDAALRPLGAYYRVDARSVADMQAAIFETGAVYCSADVHAGWDALENHKTDDGLVINKIPFLDVKTGCHAFALVGFTKDGFIVQNSWGSSWGTGGFALLTYADWVTNGYDAWVAAIGAPMGVTAPHTAGHAGLALAGLSLGSSSAGTTAIAGNIPLWDISTAYDHSIIIGNNGRLSNRIVGAKKPEDALDHVLRNNVGKSPHKHIVLYVHGGLNDEDAAISRARRLGPWFDANGICPVFVIWRTGILESLGGIAADEIAKFEEQAKAIRAKGLGGIFKSALDALAEAKDRAFEAAAEKFIGKPVWTQMKQNAASAGGEKGSLAQILDRLPKEGGKSLHLLGHSAGAIMIGHLLDTARLTHKDMRFKTCGLYAPACTLDFAIEKYGAAAAPGNALETAQIHVDILTDKAETADSVGPYGKSLLYLVSRALEDVHKTPLLGLELCIKPDKAQKDPGMEFDKKQLNLAVKAWELAVGGKNKTPIESHSGPQIKMATGRTIPIAHGSFDNDLDVVEASVRRVLGRADGDILPKPIVDLTGF